MSVVLARPSAQARSTTQRNALLAMAHMRLVMLLLLFAAAVSVVIGRLAWFGITTAAHAERTGAAGLMDRGDIVDRNGEPLARTIAAWTIGVHPRDVRGDRNVLAGRIADLTGRDQGEILALLNRDVPFVYLDRHATATLVNAVHAIGEPAIQVSQEAERLYPQSTLAAHVLGYVAPTDADPRVVGRAGVERAFDDRLMDPDYVGQPLALSIDNRVQAAMDSELGNAMAAFRAKGAIGVVLDVHTGEIVAMSSLPTYNPNRLKGANAEALRNNVTQSVYELGSTFKPITAAAALEDGVVRDIGRRFDATRPLQVGRFTIHDDRGHEQKRWLNIPETLIYSSNIATARIADELGAGRMQAMFRRMGFDGKPAIELREKQAPIWPRYWARTTVMTTAYGHGIAVTPLNLANAYATLVNGGILRPTTLLKVPAGKAVAGKRVLSEATSARMRQMLRLIVLDGTGKKGEAPGFRVGGKTGTAEVAGAGGYARHQNVSTFAAAFPMDAPRYVVVAMLDSPIGNAQSYGLTTAAWTAAPVVSRVIARTGPLLGVIPDAYRDIDVSDLSALLWHAKPVDKAGAE